MIWVACATFGTIGTAGVKYGADGWNRARGGRLARKAVVACYDILAMKTAK